MAIWVLDSKGSLFVVDPAVRKIVAEVPVGIAFQSMTIGEGAIWLVDYENGTIARVHPRQKRIETVVPVGERPIHAVVGAGGVWVKHQDVEAGVTRIDPATNLTSSVLLLDGVPLAVGHGAVWAVRSQGFDQSALVRYDPKTELATVVAEAWNLGPVVTDENGVWISHQTNGREAISRIDFSLGQPVETFALPKGTLVGSLVVLNGMPIAAVFPDEEGPSSTLSSGKELLRFDPSTKRVSARISVAKHYELVAGYEAIWACNREGRDVLRIDPTQFVITDRIDVSDRLRAIDIEDH